MFIPLVNYENYETTLLQVGQSNSDVWDTLQEPWIDISRVRCNHTAHNADLQK